jgi:plastocyanin
MLNWQPASIEPGKSVAFVVGLTDNNGVKLSTASYDFTVKDANGTTVKAYTNEQANTGSGRQLPVTFEKPGTYDVTVLVNSVAGIDTGVFTEDVSYHVVVVPEFPGGASTIALPISIVAVVSIAIVAKVKARWKKV